MKKPNKAFTLAEIMIVLAIIGVLTAVMLPATFHATPDENVMKFKKANITVASVIREISSTGQYYKEGDLRYKPNGTTLANSTNNYMCQVIADFISTKAVNCANNGGTTSIYVQPTTSATSTQTACASNTICNLAKGKAKLDSVCSAITSPKGITAADGVIWYEAAQTTTLADPGCTSAPDCNNAYKVLCLKIDTLYFGYGVRSDGKIITGANADTYLNKSIQEKD